MRYGKFIYILAILLALCACKDKTWNNPHKASEKNANIFYSSFTEPPKTLDPARSYSSNEILFNAQIYEPPLQYHYLQKPYTLVPLAATRIPEVKYFDKNYKLLPKDSTADAVAYTEYIIRIKPGILYAPHPAFAQTKNGKFLYHNLQEKDLENIHTLSDFKQHSTHELTAEDYVYQIKRLAHPELNSPILGLMQNYIVGLKDYAQVILQVYDKKLAKGKEDIYLNLHNHPLKGVKVLDNYSYKIIIKGQYPQFLYWLAMPFFSPIPWEADIFYSQPGMDEKNLTFDWYPIGTGPYMLIENNPNKQMALVINPNFHGEFYPATGLFGGNPIPFIDKFIFSLEKESISRWNKFLQGYYDRSSISSDSFDQAIQIDKEGKPQLTENLRQKGVYLQTTVSPSIYYFGFNMMNDLVGGKSARARKLRQAISIALNQEEFIAIFMNGRGIPAHGPVPPEIFGYQDDFNPIVYEKNNDEIKRKSLQEAKKLLAEAGYPNGRDSKTGKPLIINYDVPSTSGADDKARFDWMRKQFAKLDIQLNIRATQYNRFQEKMRTGNAQFFSWGWLADYPDPENFLFLLYGPNSRVKHGGENAANYTNSKYDQLFEQMKTMPNNQAREVIIKQMVDILRVDAPWVWGFHPKDFLLLHQWNSPPVPNAMANNTLKYLKINPGQREKLRAKWNQPRLWPIAILFLLFILALAPVMIQFWRMEHNTHRD